MDSDDYYTLEEVMYLFNKSKSTIIREANAGAIPYALEPGKKRGKQYPKKAIDVLVERQRKKSQPPAPKCVFSSSTISDLWSEVEIERELVGDDASISYATLLEWRDHNAAMRMSLKEAGRVIAYASLMPLAEQTITSLLAGQIAVKDLPPDAILPWTNPQLAVYIANITVKPTEDDTLHTLRGWMILRHTLQWALALHHQYDIHTWYGLGATRTTQQLFTALGFHEITSLANGQRKGYKLSKNEFPSVKLLSKM